METDNEDLIGIVNNPFKSITLLDHDQIFRQSDDLVNEIITMNLEDNIDIFIRGLPPSP
jgi:hypothetical protein